MILVTVESPTICLGSAACACCSHDNCSICSSRASEGWGRVRCLSLFERPVFLLEKFFID